jgi:hypothetical protein
LHRRLLRLEFTALDQPSAYRAVGMSVLVGVIEAHALAIGELNLPRTLDLHEEEINRVVDPEQGLW